MVRVLNVAEKNDAAKSIADIMSRGHFSKREGFSKYNKIYEFEYNLFNQKTLMSMTSVSGHMLNFEFIGQYRHWLNCNPASLFDAPVQKICPNDYTDIKRTLEKEIKGCQTLIIWTDCDREGENIGFEIIQVCQQVKPNIKVLRARFSEITPPAIKRALNNLVEPDQRTSEAVDVRQELDLRIGAAFTRFQTLRLRKVFPEVLSEQLISYGSCQFPTLGFVVERFKQVQEFIQEPFWKLKVTHKRDDCSVDFVWKRQRLFDHMACLILYEHCIEKPDAKVINVKSKPKSRWRPVALDTVELEKNASRKLKMNAKETMKIAEKLYTQGYISYPRTETNMFPKDMNLADLVRHQVNDPQWGEFAQQVLDRGPNPRNGHKTDKAHPPIHPTKYTNSLQGNEKRIYEFVVRHFLACCSQDAQGQETIVDIVINGEKFSASGLMIIARNYLDVYPYDKWNAKVIPVYHSGEVFRPTLIEMSQSETTPPPLLTEADLISLMEKYGIGTDATHAEHIETIKSRMYVGVRDDGRFIPGELGMGLVEGYDAMGFEMSKPYLRAELEADLKRICEGVKAKEVVLQEQIQKYKSVFLEAVRQANKIDQALAQYFGNAQTYTEQDFPSLEPVYKCLKCGSDMIIKKKKSGHGYFVSCTGFPDCHEAIWFPDFVLSATVSDTVCNKCQLGPRKKIKFTFKKGSVPVYIPLEYEGCICGCDETLTEILQVCGYSSGPLSRPSSGTSSTMTQSRSYSTSTQSSSQSFTRMPLSTTQNTPSFLGNRQNSGKRPGTENHQPKGHNTTSKRDSFTSATSVHSAGRLSTAVDRAPGFVATRPGTSDRKVPHTGSWRNDNSPVVCNCGDDGRLYTVRKEGPNTGRQFYACAKPPESKCSFFLWADESPPDTSSSSNITPEQQRGNDFSSFTSNTSVASDDSVVKCNCGTEAKSLTVNKEGPNKGRPFYACPKPMGQGCGFFKWGDEAGDEGRGNGGSWPSQSHDRKKQQRKGQMTSKISAGQKRKRHCGHCGEEGHTKKTCPQLH